MPLPLLRPMEPDFEPDLTNSTHDWYLGAVLAAAAAGCVDHHRVPSMNAPVHGKLNLHDRHPVASNVLRKNFAEHSGQKSKLGTPWLIPEVASTRK